MGLFIVLASIALAVFLFNFMKGQSTKPTPVPDVPTIPGIKFPESPTAAKLRASRAAALEWARKNRLCS